MIVAIMVWAVVFASEWDDLFSPLQGLFDALKKYSLEVAILAVIVGGTLMAVGHSKGRTYLGGGIIAVTILLWFLGVYLPGLHAKYGI